jgi:SAM-dependent methyltransferase
MNQAKDKINFGDLRRLTPITRSFGGERGQPVDRYYIERFLSRHALDIQGHVLEFENDTYTRRLGGDRVTRSDVLHAEAGNPQATIIADLSNAPHIPDQSFDCIICTQTLMYVYQIRAGIETLHRILKPRGVLLVSYPGISQINRYAMDHGGDYWRFTSLSAKRLFEEVFSNNGLEVKTHGNVLAATSFLYGLATEDLTPEELNHHDPDYEVLITLRAVRTD